MVVNYTYVSPYEVEDVDNLKEGEERVREDIMEGRKPGPDQCYDSGIIQKEIEEIKEGDRVLVSGDPSELWISDYNTRVCSLATVMETPTPLDKKVLLTIDNIDGESNVCLFVRKSKVKLIEE